jgi:hypothetical protein
MRKVKAPMKGRDDCVAGAHNSTALPRISQSSAMQRLSLIQWLKDHQQITTLQARNELGIMHPAGRVQELRDSGCTIETYWQWAPDATGKQRKQALYVLMSENEGAA